MAKAMSIPPMPMPSIPMPPQVGVWLSAPRRNCPGTAKPLKVDLMTDSVTGS